MAKAKTQEVKVAEAALTVKQTTVVPSISANRKPRKSKYRLDELTAGTHVAVPESDGQKLRNAVAAYRNNHKDDLVGKGIKLVTRSFVAEEDGKTVKQVGVFAVKVEQATE